MMRRILLLTLLFSAVAVAGATAQTLETFKRRLAVPESQPGRSFEPVRVIAEEYGDTARAVAEASRAEQRDRVSGYRVCIFSDNGPEAREGAFAAMKLFSETYPGVKAYMGYDVPYFKVSVGNCLTTEEAIILKERVSATFPKAFVKSEELSIGDFVK